MSEPSRMPRYNVSNDGIGPYAVFYCDKCEREYRSQPDVGGTIAKDIGRQAAGDMLRRIPIFGRAVADNVAGEDPRYSNSLTPAQLDKAWGQVRQYFRECPTCQQILCLSDFDEKSGYCQDDSPRANEIAQAQAEQAASVAKGIANVFGLSGVMQASRRDSATRQRDDRALPQGWHPGRSRDQVLPRMWRRDDPARGREVLQVRR